MKEIAEVVGVALSRVSQIRQEAMKKLKIILSHLSDRPNRNGFSTGSNHGY
jgi:DNA-directed RNA polymerase sigma subunit (sigma70/sigma32)